MTLDYKILGQLYYGPEINETPEIPGTSGYYTSVTGGIANRFVAFGTDTGQVTYSDDGLNWTAVTVPGIYYPSVAYGDGKFVAISYLYPIIYSADGITWTESAYVANSSVTLTYGNGKFVAVDFIGNKAISSSDGITWTESTLPGNYNWTEITYGNGIFLASASRVTAYSTDGITWTEGEVPNFSNNFSVGSMAYGNGLFVAISGQGNSVTAYSTDGITWTEGTIPITFGNLIYGDGKFVAISFSGSAYSTDGITWTLGGTISNENWSNIAYGNGLFVSVAWFTNKVAYSADGITWTETYASPGSSYHSIVFGQVNTLVEVQISIGGQGTPGSYVELVEPQVLYTVPAGTETTVTSIYVTNHDLIQRTYDLAVVPQGETLSLKHHIRWDMPVSASDFDLTTAKLTLSAGDKIYVFPSTINKVGFTAFGVEKS